MRGIKKIFAILGRILLSTIFILSALHKIFEWQKTQTGLLNLFCDWESYISTFPSFAKLFSNLITWVPEILIVFIIIELISALLIFFGIKEKFGAFLLILIFIPATIVVHPFWFLSGIKRSMELILFLKNLSILGGLFLLIAFESKMQQDVIFSQPDISKPDQIDENE